MRDELDRIHDGQMANLVLQDLKLKIRDRENTIIIGLIRDYRGNKLDGTKAIAAIATIDGLRSLLGDYEKKVTQGIEAMEDAHAQA